MGTYNYLDIVPKGRDEDSLSHTMEWVRYHDRYDEGKFVELTRRTAPVQESKNTADPEDKHS